MNFRWLKCWDSLLTISLAAVITFGHSQVNAAVNEEIMLGQALEEATPYLSGEATKELGEKDLVDIRERIKTLEQRLTASRQNLAASEEKLQVNYTKLSEIRERKLTLASQLQAVNDEIVFTERQTVMVGEHIQARQREIEQLDQDIIAHNQQLEQQRAILSLVVRELYDQDQRPPLLALFSSQGFAEHLNQRSYLTRVEKVGEQQYQGIKQLRNGLIAERVSLNQMESSLRELTEHLRQRRESLALQEEAKLRFLSETQEEEELYRKLLEDGRRKEAKIDAEIAELRLDLKALLEKDPGLLARDPEILTFLQTPGGRGFIWPVSPWRGLSAYFLDQDYQYIFGLPHHAIDIRTPQGTAVKAAASAYVLKARDNGYGYSYIVLAHGGGLITVYGHIQEIVVQEGQTVRQGEIIGFSGGTPGSRGAGWLTTGPHLHFEVRLEGQPQNPIPFLPAIEALGEWEENR